MGYSSWEYKAHNMNNTNKNPKIDKIIVGVTMKIIFDDKFYGFISKNTPYHQFIYKNVDEFRKRYFELYSNIFDSVVIYTLYSDDTCDNIIIIKCINDLILNIWVINRVEMLILSKTYRT